MSCQKNSKYYIPNIDEFFIGFEYELKLSFSDGTAKSQEQFDDDIKYPWRKEITDIGDFPYINRSLNGINSRKNRCGIRVKYLDKEDIESFGFNFLYKDDNAVIYKKDNALLTFIEDDFVNIHIINCDINEFESNIKNKSELKRVLIKYNIIEE